MTKIQKIGLGTAAIGRPQYINIRTEATTEFSLENFRRKGLEMLNNAYHQGIRYFDTAPGYGMAEQLLIDWITEKDDPSIEVATKWGYTYVANFDPTSKIHEVKDHSLEKLNEQWEQSKMLLPFLSTYQIHSATFETGVLENEEVLRRLVKLKNKYSILIGLSSTGVNQSEVIKKALDIEVDGKSLFDVFQVTYNIFDQSIAEISNRISSQNKRIVIKEALANGRVFPNEKYPNYKTTYKILNDIAKKYRVGVDAIALRFCTDSIPVFKVLSGAANELHLSDNIKTTQFELEENDIEILKELKIAPSYYWNERRQLAWN